MGMSEYSSVPDRPEYTPFWHKKNENFTELTMCSSEDAALQTFVEQELAKIQEMQAVAQRCGGKCLSLVYCQPLDDRQVSNIKKLT